MNRRVGDTSRVSSAVALGFFILSHIASFAALAATPPNILFIYTDDQGAWTIGASGNPQAHTPNIDRIYNEGVVFRNAFVHSPVCSPARATLMTGRHGSEMMILDWIRPGGEDWLGLDPKLPTWPRLLKDAGYRTALIGKWHVGRRPEYHPTNYGYEHFMGRLEGGWKVNNPIMEKDGKLQPFKGLTEDLLTDDALAYIEKHAKETWLVSLHYRAPHAAWLPVGPGDAEPHVATHPNFKKPHPDLENFKDKAFQDNTRDYYSSVSCVDRNVGRLLRKLDVLGIDENTLVIFSSDHGYNVGHYGLWSKGNAQRRYIPHGPQRYANFKPVQRPNLYDTSIKVPCAMRWKGKIPEGTSVDHFVNNSDWFPTLCEAAGVTVPKAVKLHGKSFWKTALGEPLAKGEPIGSAQGEPIGSAQGRQAWYGEWDMRQGAYVQMRAIRTERWKLIVDFLNDDLEGKRRGELYDLQADPQERYNRYADPALAGTRKQLMKQLVAKMRDVDPVPDASLGRRAININFASKNRYDLLPPGKIAGMVPLGIWNNLNESLTGVANRKRHKLFDSDGEETEAMLVVRPGAFVSNNKGSDRTLLDPNELLMQGWVGLAEGHVIAVHDIPEAFEASGYDLYLYCDADTVGDAARTFTFTVEKQTRTLRELPENFSAATGFKTGERGNVVVFRNLRDHILTIQGGSDHGRAAVNALQIVQRR